MLRSGVVGHDWCDGDRKLASFLQQCIKVSLTCCIACIPLSILLDEQLLNFGMDLGNVCGGHCRLHEGHAMRLQISQQLQELRLVVGAGLAAHSLHASDLQQLTSALPTACKAPGAARNRVATCQACLTGGRAEETWQCISDCDKQPRAGILRTLDAFSESAAPASHTKVPPKAHRDAGKRLLLDAPLSLAVV